MFKKWLKNQLLKYEINIEEYLNYILTLLDSNENIKDFIIEIITSHSHSHINNEEIEIFIKDIERYYKNNNEIPKEDNQKKKEKKKKNKNIKDRIEEEKELKNDFDNNNDINNSYNYKEDNGNDDSNILDEINHINLEDLELDHIVENKNYSNGDDYNENYGDYEGEELEQEEIVELIDYVELAGALESYLQTNYPSMVLSNDAILQSIYYTNGNISIAYRLLEYNYQLCSSSLSRPCRHLIQTGKCLRSDCIFDHYFSLRTCKFWLTQGCLSQECLFLHDIIYPENFELEISQYDNPSIINDLNTNTNLVANTNSLSDFPELVSTKTSSGLKFDQKNTVQNYKIALNKDSDKESTKSSINSTNLNSTRQVKESSSIAYREWVESGKSVGLNYQKSREDARTLAIARNKLLEEATQAYLRGARDIAKKLSKEGQELNQQMKQSHREAAMIIFRQRNTFQSIFIDYRLDLHGLHVQEARECVITMLNQISQKVESSSLTTYPRVTIITGTGHHTNGPQKGVPRVLKSIEELCQEYNLSYGYIKDPKGYIGGIFVQLRNGIEWNL